VNSLTDTLRQGAARREEGRKETCQLFGLPRTSRSEGYVIGRGAPVPNESTRRKVEILASISGTSKSRHIEVSTREVRQVLLRSGTIMQGGYPFLCDILTLNRRGPGSHRDRGWGTRIATRIGKTKVEFSTREFRHNPADRPTAPAITRGATGFFSTSGRSTLPTDASGTSVCGRQMMRSWKREGQMTAAVPPVPRHLALTEYRPQYSSHLRKILTEVFAHRHFYPMPIERNEMKVHPVRCLRHVVALLFHR
jgi:hypothetical protein